MDAVVVALRTGTESAVGGPPTLANPLLDLFEVSMTRRAQIVEMRNTSIAKYAFAIPTVQALDRIRECSPGGVVEIGAGTGYWAHAFHQRGVDVEAYDIEPAPSLRNAWFAGTPPWYRVQRRDDGVAGEHPGRTLLIVWPTKNEIWAAAAVERYFEAGGMCVVHVGEGPGVALATTYSTHCSASSSRALSARTVPQPHRASATSRRNGAEPRPSCCPTGGLPRRRSRLLATTPVTPDAAASIPETTPTLVPTE